MITFILLIILIIPATAMNCSKATSKIDQKICSNGEFKSTDATKSAAYFKLLNNIKDGEIYASLVASQHRWLKAGDNDLSDLTHWNDGRNAPDADQQRAILLSTIRQRTKDLATYSDTQPNFVNLALTQRQLASAYSSGALAGYPGSCSFIPDRTNLNHWTYHCFGSRTYQKGNRVCSDNNDFASYITEVTRNMSIVQNGKSKLIASCAVGTDTDTDNQCPDGKLDSNNTARRNTTAEEKT